MNAALTWLESFLAARTARSLVVIASALALAITVADFLTGYFFSLGIFYLAPVGIAAWYVSRRAGMYFALICAALWYLANAVVAPEQISPLIPAWNSLVRLGYFSAVSFLLSSLKQAFNFQRGLAETDALTGLLNRRAFVAQSRNELSRAARQGVCPTLLYIDLDNFKQVNDTGGHLAGDVFLQQVGKALSNAVRTSDIVGRLGGDEFGVLLSGAQADQVGVVAKRVQAAILQLSNDPALHVSATIGGAAWLPGETVEALIQRADRLMYEGKTRSKGTANLEASPAGG